MRHVNELASHQAERQNKRSSERRLASSCEVNAATTDSKSSENANRQILTAIPEIKSDVDSLKRRQVKQETEMRDVRDRKESYQPRGHSRSSRMRGRGCQDCKWRGQGDTCRHCFACGEIGHIASKCAKNARETQGNGRRLTQTRDGD